MYVVEEANKNLKLTEILEELQNKGGNRKKIFIRTFQWIYPKVRSVNYNFQKNTFRTDNQANTSTSKLQTFILKKPNTPPNKPPQHNKSADTV